MSNMRGYKEVSTQQELDIFDDVVDGFVDSILKEARLLNNGYVEIDGQGLCEGGAFDMQLIIQSQRREYEIEVFLCHVESFDFGYWNITDGMALSIKESGSWPEREIRIGELCIAAQMYYKTRPKSGLGAMLGAELPSSTAVEATSIKPDWRLCSKCCDAWEEADDVQFSRCPSCKTLTELIVDSA